MDFVGEHKDLWRFPSDFQSVDCKNMMVYKGAFGRVPFSMIDIYSRSVMPNDPVLRKKVRFVSVEMAQNVNFYSAEKLGGDGVGCIALGETENGIVIATGNLAGAEDCSVLTGRLDKAGSFGEKELHAYKQKLMLESFDMSENANIGLVQSIIVAGSGFRYRSVPVAPDKYFVTLEIEIKQEYTKKNYG